MNPLREPLLRSAAVIRGLGFRVFVPEDEERSWGFFSDGRSIGYFQQSEWHEGVELATVNRVPGSDAMHLLLETEGRSTPPGDLTGEALRKAFRDYPDYYDEEERAATRVIKYTGVEEFLRKEGQGLVELVN